MEVGVVMAELVGDGDGVGGTGVEKFNIVEQRVKVSPVVRVVIGSVVYLSSGLEGATGSV